ncbi:MAG: hypothetical protein H7Z42_10480 [Roseiflexaceae bacterium]|nr:hypothetical protein [Roseiflexaceae bacterium]
MSRNYNYRRSPPPPPRRRGGLGCLGSLVLLVWILVAAVLAYNFFLRPQISQMIGDQIIQAGPPSNTTDQLSEQAGQALPTVVAALPSGELRLSEQQANEFLAARDLGPFDSAAVRFTQGRVEITIGAFGLTSTARSGLAVQDGRVITVEPQIDGALGQLISLDDLTASIEDQLNAQLSSQGRTVQSVTVNEGELVVNVQ